MLVMYSLFIHLATLPMQKLYNQEQWKYTQNYFIYGPILL